MSAEDWLEQLDPASVESRPAFEVHWSEEDGEFVGTTALYPSLSWLAPTERAALDGIRRLVEDAADA